MSNATVDAILDNARAALPGVADDVVLQALFTTCDDLARDSIRAPAPASVDGDPALWLPTDQWVPNYQPLLAGTLALLYGQATKPYYNADFAKFYGDRYNGYKTASRMSQAGSVAATDSIPERVVSAVRAQIQLVRDEAVKLEMFNFVNKIRIEAYGFAPLTGADTDYVSWLTTPQYEESYLAILHGTLCGLYGQSNMPWYNADLYQSQFSLYQLELDLVRNANIKPVGGLDTLIDEVKPHLPGARDDVLWIELRRCVDEFLKTTQVWEEDIKLRVSPSRTVYCLEVESSSTIVRLIWVATSSGNPVRASMMDIPTLVLERAPDVRDTYTVTVALSLMSTGTCSVCSKPNTSCVCGNSLGFPNWIFDRWHEAFFDGLIGRMMLQPGKPYSGTILTSGGRIASDPTSYHLKRFRSAMAEARSAARTQNIYAGQRWRFPAFA